MGLLFFLLLVLVGMGSFFAGAAYVAILVPDAALKRREAKRELDAAYERGLGLLGEVRAEVARYRR